MKILAIDQGTTSTRALFVDDQGHARVTCSVQHKQLYPQDGWVEHEPEELIASLRQCLRSCAEVDAVGIDNQGESCVAWDADTGKAISPVIVWQDNRTQKFIEELIDRGVEQHVLETTGLPLDPYFSGSKLGWIMQHVPKATRLAEQGRLRLGTTDAFFLDRLTGRFVTDITTASRTSLMNLDSGQWDEEMCRLFGVPVDCLPEILSTTGDFGVLNCDGQAVPVTTSVVDQQASLYGHGCRELGDAKITFGTGAFALMLTGETVLRSPEQGLLPTPAWQFVGQSPVYALDGGVYNAGSAIEWAKRLGFFTDYHELNQFSHDSAVDRDLVFVPALSGIACPYWDRRAAGLFLGMSLNTDKHDMMQAVLEGIAFRAAQVIQAMNDLHPVGNRVSIDGGLSVNPYFCQFLADVLERTVTVQTFGELTAMGTASLAGANSIQSIDGKEQALITFEPKVDRRVGCQRFTDAVEVALGWRRDSV